MTPNVKGLNMASLAKAFFTLVVLNFMVLVSTPLHSAASSSNHFLVKTWTTEKGLSHNTIADITQSEDKYIWLTSWEGVDRFDGHTFTNIKNIFNVPVTDNAARSFAKDKNGNIYVGGSKGQVLMRKDDGQWDEFVRLDSQINIMTFHPHHQLIVVTEEQKIYSITNSRQPTELVRSLPKADDRITSIKTVAETIVVGTTSGLYLLHDMRLVPFAGLSGERINQIEYAQKQLFVATEQGIITLSGDEFEKSEWLVKDYNVLALTIDSVGRLWFGTARNGLYLRDNKGTFTNIGIGENLANNRVTQVFEDHEQNIWVGTVGGLSLIKQTEFTTITASHGLQSNYVRTVIEGPNGDIWIGSSNGLARFDKSTNKVTASYLDGQSVLSTAINQDNNMLVGTYTDGVFIQSGEQFVPYLSTDNGLPSNQVRSILTNANGATWFGTDQGLMRVQGGVQTVFSSGLSSNIVAVVKEIDGQVWAGTSRGIEIIEDDKFVDSPALAPLQTGHVFDFNEDKQLNVVWIATDAGLYRYDLNNQSLARLPKFGYKNVAKFFTVIRDKSNYLWLSSNQGVFRVSVNSINRVMNGENIQLEYDVFEESEGLLSKQANGRSTPAGYIDSDNQIWFATSKGAVRANTEQLQTYENVVNSLRIESIEIDKVFQPLGKAIELEAHHQHLRVGFTNINLMAPNRTTYRARLIGFDKEWENRGSINSVEYTSLEPGNYTLEISTSIAPYDWSRPVKLNIIKLPHWWETTVFRLSLVTFIVILIGVAFYYKAMLESRRHALLEEKIKQKTNKLEQRSKELSEANKEKTELLDKLIENTRILEQLSREDSLTKVLNRRAFTEECSKWDAYSQRKGSEYCIAFLDIDNFKQVNDEYSHSVGDEALKSIANVIKSSVRDVDIVARWGGEEFVVLFPDTELSSAMICAQRIRMSVEQQDDSTIAANLNLTISGGVATSLDTETYEQTIHLADMALYRAKEAGRNTICVDEPSASHVEMKNVN